MRQLADKGSIDFFHYDFYSQALAKIERGHDKDLVDVAAMRERDLIEPAQLRELFEKIEPKLYRYPALDPGAFRARVEEAVADTAADHAQDDEGR